MQLNDDLTTMTPINVGGTIIINNLSTSVGIMRENQFFELWYNEDMGFQMIMDPISTLQNTGYHWYLGVYQLKSLYDNNFEIQCIIASNKIYFRRD